MQSGPIPPLVPKTRGVKYPISTSSTLCWYFRFFPSSFSLKIVDVTFPWLYLELTCVTLTSKISMRPKSPCLQVQSCLRVCYRASEVESLITERFQLWFDFNIGANLTNKGKVGCEHHRVSAPRTLPFGMTGHGRRYTSHHKHTCLVSRTGAYYTLNAESL